MSPFKIISESAGILRAMYVGMKKERAQYILRTMSHGNPRFTFGGIRGGGTLIYPDGITQTEDAYIRKAWDKLSGSSCYMSVIYEIAKGRKFMVNEQDKVEALLEGEL